jgi:hypothetical protein
MNYRICLQNGRPKVDGNALIFYHFHGLKIINRWLYEPGFSGYKRMPLPLCLWLYSSYLRAMRDALRWARTAVPDITLSNSDARMGAYGWRRFTRRLLQGQIMMSTAMSDQRGA